MLIAVDWGTSTLRGARLGPAGRVLEERTFARGILTVEPGGFGALFDRLFGDWLQPADALALIAGMAGSRQGWVEAPYVACPAGADDLLARLAWVDPGRIAIVPGLVCEHGDPGAGVPDVMRGEETQVIGALALLAADHGVFVLPGTHSKWVRVEAGRIVGFETLMTGEFYALLRRHSILARTLPPLDGGADAVAGAAADDRFDAGAFDAGVAHALRGPGLLRTAFSARTLALFDRQPEAARPSYLSGLVIGEELRSRQPLGAGPVVLIGADMLVRRYARALASCGVAVETVGAAAAWRGLWSIGRRIDR